MEDKLTILIVNKIETERTMLSLLFREDYGIVTAYNVSAVMKALREDHAVDIILLDLDMPDGEGFELLELLKRDSQWEQIPVVAFSGKKEPQDEIKALELGAEDFILKPYHQQLVLRRVQNVIRKSVLERKQMEKAVEDAHEKVSESVKELKFRAERDWLTGIYNRITFYRRTEQLLRENPKTEYVLILWNIERFKVINELFGNAKGDEILIRLANKIHNEFSGKGIYGKLEADRFVVCITKECLKSQSSRIRKMLDKGLGEVKIGYPVQLHIGIYEIQDINTPINLMCDRASLALQTIKGNYVKRYAYYNNFLRENLLTEQQLIADMDQALKEQQFFVEIQPIYSAATRQPVSGEALVRWKHPKRGFIAPGVFIPIFEKNGFIAKLDYFVWDKVCQFLFERQKQGLPVQPVSVNVSRINLYSGDLCDKIMELLENYQLDPSLLKLEITESMYMDNPYQLLGAMSKLQKNGIKILMDDFGSGYSSLNMLKDIPVDTLKVDMEFINVLETSERAGTILTSVVRMAKALNMEVIAEGVETKNQYLYLRDVGCDYIQGWYFSKSLALEQYAELISKPFSQNISREDCEKGQTILIVDDSNSMRTSLCRVLGDDYEVLCAENGVEAFEILKDPSCMVDLILTDLVMPKLDGFGLLSLLRQDTVLRHIPVLGITSLESKEDYIRALQMGALDVIKKPIHEAEVKQRVHNLLAMAQTERLQADIHNMKEVLELKRHLQEMLDNLWISVYRVHVHKETKEAKLLYGNKAFFALRDTPKVELHNLHIQDYCNENVSEEDNQRLSSKVSDAIYRGDSETTGTFELREPGKPVKTYFMRCEIRYEDDGYILDFIELDLACIFDDNGVLQ